MTVFESNLGGAAPETMVGESVVRVRPRTTVQWAGAFVNVTVVIAAIARFSVDGSPNYRMIAWWAMLIAGTMLTCFVSYHRTSLIEVSSSGIRFHGPGGVIDDLAVSDIAAAGIIGPVLGDLIVPSNGGWLKGGQLVVIAPSGHLVCTRKVGWFRLADLQAATAQFGIVIERWPGYHPNPFTLRPARWPSAVDGPAAGRAADDPLTAAAVHRAAERARRLVWVALGVAAASIVLLVVLEQPQVDWLNVAAGWTFGFVLFGSILVLITGPLRNRPLRLAGRFLAAQPWYACEAVVMDGLGGTMKSNTRQVTFLHPTTGAPMGTLEVEAGAYGRWLQPMQRCWLLCVNGTDGKPVIVAPPARNVFAHLKKNR